jgi:hypothetical protein
MKECPTLAARLLRPVGKQKLAPIESALKIRVVDSLTARKQERVKGGFQLSHCRKGVSRHSYRSKSFPHFVLDFILRSYYIHSHPRS